MIRLGSLYDSPMNQIESVGPETWESWVAENDAIVLDVREPKEWALGTLPDSVRISQGDIVERLDELDKSQPILCVCRSGGRSDNVAKFLAFNGYEVANLEGGLKGLGMQT